MTLQSCPRRTVQLAWPLKAMTALMAQGNAWGRQKHKAHLDKVADLLMRLSTDSKFLLECCKLSILCVQKSSLQVPHLPC